MNITPDTIEFIRSHAEDDIRLLALSAAKNASIDLPFALDQIRGRQIARHKLPSWAAVDGIIYPPHISMEQCSSEQTARYKAGVLATYIKKEEAVFVDITGGFGVDFSYLAQDFSRCVYVERQEHLCEIARHNFPLLDLPEAEVVCGDGVEWIKGQVEDCISPPNVTTPSPSGEGKGRGTNLAFFIDPARRDSHGNRTYAIGDCTPDIIGFIDEMTEKASVVMIKLSPMLDWHATVNDINRAVKGNDAVREVHIISTANECKELLIIVSTKRKDPLKVFCVNDEQVFSFSPSSSPSNVTTPSPSGEGKGRGATHLFIPNASIMKAGCFDQVGWHFDVNQISGNSHIFVADHDIADFPGKSYRNSSISSMNKKELRKALDGITQANIATRNFPLSPEQLRKRLKLRDGGDIYIFATTTADQQHVLYITRRNK